MTRIAVILLAVSCFPGGTGRAQTAPDPAPAALLEVPYLPQSELLCGGAALAMVERWWGRRQVYAEDFGALVRPELRGIRTADLAAAARTRGWEALVLDAPSEILESAVRRGVPAIVLLAVGRNRFHYVVVLGWHAGTVTVHDPALAPAMRIDERRFLEQWNAADRWAMVIRPGPTQPSDRPPPTAPVTASAVTQSLPCPPWIEQAIDLATRDELEPAARALEAARTSCPAEPTVERELAGVRFKQRRFADAAGLAVGYLARAPADSLGWQLLASSRYLAGDEAGALAAWNRIGQPTVDLVRVHGIDRLRFRSVSDAIAIRPGATLTTSTLSLAARRVGSLPTVAAAAVRYRPVENHLLEVEATIAERPVLPSPHIWLVGNGVGALAQDRVVLEVANPLHFGERWSGVWRWDQARPSLALGVEIPVRLGFPGVMTLESARGELRVGTDTAATGRTVESLRRASMAFGGWISSWARPSLTLRLEDWTADRRAFVTTAALDGLAARDRAAFRVSAGSGLGLGTSSGYLAASVAAGWTSSVGLRRTSWSARLGADWTSQGAPLGVRPRVGTDLSWSIPLRAHRETGAETIVGGNLGAGLLHWGLAADQPLARIGPVVVAAGVFLDGASVSRPASGVTGRRTYLDGGAGLRVALGTGELGVLRIDAARALMTDRRSAITVGFERRWPLLIGATR